ncbi:unnamed protein product, partial [Pleuronectes platessa]
PVNTRGQSPEYNHVLPLEGAPQIANKHLVASQVTPTLERRQPESLLLEAGGIIKHELLGSDAEKAPSPAVRPGPRVEGPHRIVSQQGLVVPRTRQNVPVSSKRPQLPRSNSQSAPHKQNTSPHVLLHLPCLLIYLPTPHLTSSSTITIPYISRTPPSTLIPTSGSVKIFSFIRPGEGEVVEACTSSVSGLFFFTASGPCQRRARRHLIFFGRSPIGSGVEETFRVPGVRAGK